VSVSKLSVQGSVFLFEDCFNRQAGVWNNHGASSSHTYSTFVAETRPSSESDVVPQRRPGRALPKDQVYKGVDGR